MTNHYANIVTKLNKNTSIDAWRAAKERADTVPDYEETLGCVGRPIAELLQRIIEEHVDAEHVIAVSKEVEQAAREARENLASFVSQYCENELSSVLDGYHFDVDDADLDTSNSLEEAFEAGVAAVENVLQGITVYVDSESLG